MRRKTKKKVVRFTMLKAFNSLQISSNQLTNPLIKIIILHNVLFPLFFSIIKTWQKYKNNKILSIYKISLVMPLINNYKPYIWLNKLQHIHFETTVSYIIITTHFINLLFL